MAAHICPDCQLLHDIPQPPAGPNPEVEIARIQADRDKYVARVSARMQSAELETAEEIAETEVAATVAAAGLEGEIIANGAEPEPAPEPLVIDAPPVEQNEIVEDAPPPAEDSHEPHEPRKSRGLGLW